ncbi:MAG: hypothetical protein C0622_10850 [Desulfuromonas sp.]|nr:MAG: hypothetical protein C0622_10850 [Desulfuromonas sp.]
MDQPTYRLRRSFNKDGQPKNYSGSYQLVDEQSQAVLASCHLCGKAVFAELETVDAWENVWRLAPNRKVMPSHWTLSDPAGCVALQFDQRIAGKIVNPLYRTALALLDEDGDEAYRLVDPRTSIPDRIFGVAPGEWGVMFGDRPVAKLVRLARNAEPAKGVFGKLRSLLAGTDQGMISAGANHALPAPVTLAMLLLFAELSETSAG